MAPRWKWNTPAVTSERFDDEVVLVNFDSGRYHSLRGSAVPLWQWLATGASLDVLITSAQQSFEGDGEAIATAVRTFISDLEREHLIVPAAGNHSDSPLECLERQPFQAPVLSTFSDMQELLLLDPIHEVDEAGWPVARNDGGH